MTELRDIDPEALYFVGTVHPASSDTPLPRNYRGSALPAVSKDLPGTILREMHYPGALGEVEHAYIGRDGSLRAVGRMDNRKECEDLDRDVVWRMLESGALDGLSLNQGGRRLGRDSSVPGWEPIGPPIDVSFTPLEQAGRGRACRIDAVMRGSEILEHRRRPKNAEDAKKGADIMRDRQEPESFNSAASKRELVELVASYHRMSQQPQPTATTPAPAAPVPMEVVAPAVPATPAAPAAAAAPAVPAQTPAAPAPDQPEVKVTDLIEMLTQQNGVTKALREEIAKMKAQNEELLKAQKTVGPPELPRDVRIASLKALHESMTERIKKLHPSGVYPPKLVDAMDKWKNIEALTDSDIPAVEDKFQAVLACSDTAMERTMENVRLREELRSKTAELESKNADLARLARDAVAVARADAAATREVLDELKKRGADFTSKIELKRQAVEAPAPAPPAIAVTVPASMVPTDLLSAIMAKAK
ncbi:MAG: hypothetical protein WC732_09955 [Candidatus Omnitrophota bacterium]